MPLQYGMQCHTQELQYTVCDGVCGACETHSIEFTPFERRAMGLWLGAHLGMYEVVQRLSAHNGVELKIDLYIKLKLPVLLSQWWVS
jgi:hypothetical protein